MCRAVRNKRNSQVKKWRLGELLDENPSGRELTDDELEEAIAELKQTAIIVKVEKKFWEPPL
jgi:hypothetical protein